MPRNARERRGSVLILVVWTMALLSVLAAGLGLRGMFSLNLVDRQEAQLALYYLLTGGIHYAAAEVARDPTPACDGLQEAWFSLDEWRAAVAGAEAVVSIDLVEDEDRRINVNTAPPDVLRRLLLVLGVEERLADEVAAAIVDWRDENDDEEEHGAEGFYYRGLSNAYACKDGPFELPEELLLVKGMTPGLWLAMKPLVTVYGSGLVNLNTAGSETLSVLGLTETGIAAILAYRAGEDNVPKNDDDRLFTATGAVVSELETTMPAEDLGRLGELIGQKVVGVRSDAYRITLSAKQGDAGQRARVTGVLHRSGRLLAWADE